MADDINPFDEDPCEECAMGIPCSYHDEDIAADLELESPADLDLELAGELDALGGCCTACGCTETTPCQGGCFWANSAMTLCSRCAQK